MSGTTWSKFYWSDWESDPALRLCSLAAQGLWMRMLCIASAHDPIGYVAVAGRGLDETALARMTGCSGSEASALLGELARNGVFSRDRQGRIYSRRMTDDARKSATARKNGKNGGNPSLLKQKENPSSDKGTDKGRLKAHKPEAREERVEREVSDETSLSCPKPRKTRHSYSPEFEEFWKGYPTSANMSKLEAWTAWRGLPAGDHRDAIASLAAFNLYCRQHPDYSPIHANRYLLKRRFEGHLAAPATNGAGVRIYPGSPEWAAWLEHKRHLGQQTRFMEGQGEAGNGFSVPSRFPPKSEAA